MEAAEVDYLVREAHLTVLRRDRDIVQGAVGAQVASSRRRPRRLTLSLREGHYSHRDVKQEHPLPTSAACKPSLKIVNIFALSRR